MAQQLGIQILLVLVTGAVTFGFTIAVQQFGNFRDKKAVRTQINAMLINAEWTLRASQEQKAVGPMGLAPLDALGARLAEKDVALSYKPSHLEILMEIQGLVPFVVDSGQRLIDLHDMLATKESAERSAAWSDDMKRNSDIYDQSVDALLSVIRRCMSQFDITPRAVLSTS